MHYQASVKNEERDSDRKAVGAGFGTLGVSARVNTAKQGCEAAGIELWLRSCGGQEDQLRVSVVDNTRISKSGETLFDGTIGEFIARLRED